MIMVLLFITDVQTDAADRCPDIPGIELNNGCPFENQGCCSDNDGDGVSNEVDQCPEVSGSVYNNGCPIDSTNLNTIDFKGVKPDIDPNHTGEQIIDNPLDPKEDNGGFDPVQISHETNVDTLLNGEEIRKLTVYFDSDQSFMQQSYIKQINELLVELKAESNEDIHFVIIGHTDQDGNDDYNLVLSRKRSETVRKHIQNQGIDFDRVKTYYYGEFKPLTSDENERAKKLNRRVEIIVVKK
jgi:OOP family OmpA-OmpF porin